MYLQSLTNYSHLIFVLLLCFGMFVCIFFLFLLLCIFFLCVFHAVVFDLLSSPYFLAFSVVGIGLRGGFLGLRRLLFVFLFCIPMLAPCLLLLVFGCLVGFWLCVEQFLF